MAISICPRMLSTRETREDFTSSNWSNRGLPVARFNAMLLKIATTLQLAIIVVAAQTNPAPGEYSVTPMTTLTQSAAQNQPATDSQKADVQHRNKIRAACIEGRRLICGKILDVLPGGLVVESGYTNLLREPLGKSWLIPGTVESSCAENLIEGATPGTVCVGLVFVVNLPRGTKVKPAKYDYVIIQGYPAGLYTYTSAGTLRRTVRRFSASLVDAVQLSVEAEEKSARFSPRHK